VIINIEYKQHEVQKYKLGKMLLFLFFNRVERVRFGGIAKIFSKKSRHQPIWEPFKVTFEYKNNHQSRKYAATA